jgi:hypothetical protein
VWFLLWVLATTYCHIDKQSSHILGDEIALVKHQLTEWLWKKNSEDTQASNYHQFKGYTTSILPQGTTKVKHHGSWQVQQLWHQTAVPTTKSQCLAVYSTFSIGAKTWSLIHKPWTLWHKIWLDWTLSAHLVSMLRMSAATPLAHI